MTINPLCSYCGQPSVGWFWSRDQGIVAWCRDHAAELWIEGVTDNECRRRELDEMGAEAAEIDAYRVANDFKETR